MFQLLPRPFRKRSSAPGRSGNSNLKSNSGLLPNVRPPTMCRTCSFAVSLSVMSLTR